MYAQRRGIDPPIHADRYKRDLRRTAVRDTPVKDALIVHPGVDYGLSNPILVGNGSRLSRESLWVADHGNSRPSLYEHPARL